MSGSSDLYLSFLVKQKAYSLGFDLCGIATSRSLTEHKPIIEEWCSSGMNGDMTYLGKDIEKRIDPGILFPGTRSVIVAGMNYYTDRQQRQDGIPLISRYAFGNDYHLVISKKLKKILDYIKIIRPGTNGRSYVDSAPILEKAWAREAGIGYPGRHSILINKKIGSFFFLGIILLDIELCCDKPYDEDHCIGCRSCIDVCPTGAINSNRTINVRKCISYLTVESKTPLPANVARKTGGRVFGCDICQEVCPWNSNAEPHDIPEFSLPEEIGKMSARNWRNLTVDQFNRLFNKSAVARRKYDLFKQNVTIVTNTIC
jgi:epoxyqueuosine reductase